MPNVGEIKRGFEMGRKGYCKRIWVLCPKCGFGHWARLIISKPRESITLCHSCALKNRVLRWKVWEKGHIPWNKGLTKETDERIVKYANTLSISLTGSYPDERLLEMSRIRKEQWANTSTKEKNRILKNFIEAGRIASKQWRKENPERMTEIIRIAHKARYSKPNKVELEVIKLLNIVCPNEYVYCGDGSVKIGDVYPDFINVNGKKKVIELFGDYWHSPDILGGRWQGSELGRIMIYNLYGFDCLVIWESELKDKDKVIQRVKEFNNK